MTAELDVCLRTALQVYINTFGELCMNEQAKVAQLDTISKLGMSLFIQGNKQQFKPDGKAPEEELATTKQITLMEQLKIPYTNKTTKKQASNLISEKLKE